MIGRVSYYTLYHTGVEADSVTTKGKAFIMCYPSITGVIIVKVLNTVASGNELFPLTRHFLSGARFWVVDFRNRSLPFRYVFITTDKTFQHWNRLPNQWDELVLTPSSYNFSYNNSRCFPLRKVTRASSED